MSTTTVCITGRDGDVHEGRCFRNSWGSAWFIWDALWRAYVDTTATVHHLSSLPSAMTRAQLWALDRDPRLPPPERITLISTFDYVMIRRDECLLVADAFDAFVRRFERRHSGPSTITLQANYLRELAAHPDIHEVCWQQNSAGSALWSVDPDRPYNVRTDTQHWQLFARYPELKPPPGG